MTRVVLIKAGPTQWDVEERISGSLPLPLTQGARENLPTLIETLPQLDAVYRCKNNDACDEVAKLIAARFKLRPRDNGQLDAWCLGLWQGLRMDELRQRYPSAIEQWEESPASVIPPEGESFADAIGRLRDALKKILRRNRGYTVAMVLRPTAMQIMAGLLRREAPDRIAAHLQNDSAVETIELEDEVLKEL